MIAYKVKLSQKAENEFRKAVKWYEEQSKGLGLRFAKQVNKRLVNVGNHPLFYPVKDLDTRQIEVVDFPYLIVYKIFPHLRSITIVSIFHMKRHPRKKI